MRQCDAVCVTVVTTTAISLRKRVREARQSTLLTVGSDESAPLRALAQLDILNAIDRARSCYLNIAETLAGGKHEKSNS